MFEVLSHALLALAAMVVVIGVAFPIVVSVFAQEFSPNTVRGSLPGCDSSALNCRRLTLLLDGPRGFRHRLSLTAPACNAAAPAKTNIVGTLTAGYRDDMGEIVRFTISLESELLEAFDGFVQQGKFPTRSEAIRQLIHDALVRHAWQTDKDEVAGTLTLVYDHHRTQVQRKLVQLQHDHADLVVATLHVHLDHDLCLEAIALRGQPDRLQEIAAGLRGIKGVHKGELVMASAQGH